MGKAIILAFRLESWKGIEQIEIQQCVACLKRLSFCSTETQ